MRRRGATGRLTTRQREFWRPLSRLGQPHCRPALPSNDVVIPALANAFKAFEIDSREPHAWERLCIEMAVILFPPEKKRGRKKRRRLDTELLTDFLNGRLPDSERQHAYEALSRLRETDPALARNVKRLAKLTLTQA